MYLPTYGYNKQMKCDYPQKINSTSKFSLIIIIQRIFYVITDISSYIYDNIKLIPSTRIFFFPTYNRA